MTGPTRSRDDDRLPLRPFWVSPLWPLLFLVLGIGLLVLDGARPYRTWWRRHHWKRVDGVLVRGYEKRRREKVTTRGVTATEYVQRRSQKRIFETVVERGWPLRRRKRVFRVRLHYTYFVGNRKRAQIADSPDREFASRREAAQFLARVIERGKVHLWVDPRNPDRATAFLQDPWSVYWVHLGLGVTIAALLWLLVVLVLARRIRRAEESAPVKDRSMQP